MSDAAAAGVREVQAVADGDWYRCGACGTRWLLGLVPVRDGARAKCGQKNCRAWNVFRIERVRE